MSDEWGFGGEPNKSKSSIKGAFLNTVILIVGVVLFLVYGFIKMVTSAEDNATLELVSNISGAVGVITIVVALLRIRSLNRRKQRGY